jgi:hypothetical protein
MIKLAIRRVKREEENTLRQWLEELSRRQSEVRETFARVMARVLAGKADAELLYECTLDT